MKRVLASLLVLSISLMAAVPFASANTYDCAEVNEVGTGVNMSGSFFVTTPIELLAGETVTLTIIPAGNGVVEFSLEGQPTETAPASQSFTAPEGGQSGVSYSVTANAGVNYTIYWSCGVDGASSGLELSGPPCYNLFDSRLNNRQNLDCAAPVALYATDNGLDIYAIDPVSGEGALALHMHAEELEQSAPVEQNTLLADGTNSFTGQPVQIYHLTTDEIAVIAYYPDGKPYSIVWPADAPAEWYHANW